MCALTSVSNRDTTPSALLKKSLLVFCAAGSFLIVAWLLKYSAYGFDFTDEGFYLASMANPFIYDYSHTQFGFVYHLLYKLFEGDVVRLRQVNILVTFGIAWAFSCVFLKSLASGKIHGKFFLPISAAGLATSSLIVFNLWLLTPSYNNLNLHGLLVASTGLMLADRSSQPSSVMGWMLVGLGGWATFMAKPSTALALALATLLYLLLARKLSIRMLLVAVMTAVVLLFLSALLIDGSIPLFADRMQRAVDFGRLLGSGHTLMQILRVDTITIARKTVIAILLICATLGISTWGILSGRKKLALVSFFVSAIFFVATVLLSFGFVRWRFPAPVTLVFGLTLAAIAASIATDRWHLVKTISRAEWVLAGLLFITPHIYAFGTNGNYWNAAEAAALFWLFSGIVFLAPAIRYRNEALLLLPIATATPFFVAVFLQAGFESPYRQPQPIRSNDTTVTFRDGVSSLILSSDYAQYISTAITTAQDSGFDPPTPIIDLSGRSPGLIHALSGENLGQAWNVGGYPGSLDLAKAAFERTSCEAISRAWVLTEPDGLRSLPNEIMYALVGNAFPSEYARVATWQTPMGAGGHAEPIRQYLYRPAVPAEIMAHCDLLRKRGNRLE